jgi:hypothetical protein
MNSNWAGIKYFGVPFLVNIEIVCIVFVINNHFDTNILLFVCNYIVIKTVTLLP